jgi:hypothetical protein
VDFLFVGNCLLACGLIGRGLGYRELHKLYGVELFDAGSMEMDLSMGVPGRGWNDEFVGQSEQVCSGPGGRVRDYWLLGCQCCGRGYTAGIKEMWGYGC